MEHYSMQTFEYNRDRVNFISVIGDIYAIKQFDSQFKGRYQSYDGGSVVRHINQLNEEELRNYMYYRILPYSSLISTCEEERVRRYVTYINNVIYQEGYSFNNFIPISIDNYLDSDKQIRRLWGTPQDMEQLRVFGMNEVDELIYNNAQNIVTEVVYCFWTAHSKCKPIIEAMVGQYPNLFFRYVYTEIDSIFKPESGLYEYQDGQLIQEIEAKVYKSGIENTDEFIKEYLTNKYYACSRYGAVNGSPVPWLTH